MWDDVVIGMGDSMNGAVRLTSIGSTDISSNETSYWINNAYLSGSMTIFKDTLEGAKLKGMVFKAPDEELIDWIEATFLKNVAPARLKRLIAFAIKQAQRDARKKKAAEIRRAFKRAFAKIEEF